DRQVGGRHIGTASPGQEAAWRAVEPFGRIGAISALAVGPRHHLHGGGLLWVREAAAIHPMLAGVVVRPHAAETGRILGGFVVVDRLVAGRETDGLGMMLLDVLRDEAELFRAAILIA